MWRNSLVLTHYARPVSIFMKIDFARDSNIIFKLTIEYSTKTPAMHTRKIIRKLLKNNIHLDFCGMKDWL